MSDCFSHNPPKCFHCKHFLRPVQPKTNGEHTDITYWGCINCQRIYREEDDCALHECIDETMDDFIDL